MLTLKRESVSTFMNYWLVSVSLDSSNVPWNIIVTTCLVGISLSLNMAVCMQSRDGIKSPDLSCRWFFLYFYFIAKWLQHENFDSKGEWKTSWKKSFFEQISHEKYWKNFYSSKLEIKASLKIKKSMVNFKGNLQCFYPIWSDDNGLMDQA